MKITVFTPTYNRGYIIEKLYNSLKRQSFNDFEWIVVDDGSTDGTDQLLERIQLEAPFSMSFKRVENGGKHRAINLGVQMATGELFFIVDSDDYLTDNSLEEIIKVERTIPNSEKHLFAGVCGLRGYSKTEIVGKTFEGDTLDTSSLERSKHNIWGDKAEVFYTSLLKQFPFPEFEDENFLTECVVWDRIAFSGFKLRFFNEIVYICNYLPDGLTAHSEQLFLNNPKGYGLYLYQCGLYGKNYGIEKWNSYLRYYGQFKGKLTLSDIAKNLHMPAVVLLLRILGLKLFYKLYDR